MMKYSRKSHSKQAEMQGNEVQNKRRESEAQNMHVRQDRIIENQLQSGEIMIKNTQNKKENAKNESMLSVQYVHKKNIIQTESQSGRSMVEMLGVLAIIGVLSIGGITGYKYAMNYYQANQIAHEINLMRTDAQVKIAQGAEELVLGNPYDDGNINFNNYETDFDCIYMENENATPDRAFCNVANAYYIEMQNIPEGVCRPLANLIDKMDNEIAFYINKKSVDAEVEGEKGACNAEPNTLRVIFGADSDSDAIKCDDDTNCPPELPVCFNHMCVECTQEKGCEGKSQYCKDNICKTCESGVWNGEKCVECTDNDDCENPTPYCNPTSTQCEHCQNDSQCDTTQNEHCKISTGECVVCEEGEEWNDEFKECVATSCQTNADCNTKGKNHYYCHFKSTTSCSAQTGFGTCVDKDKDKVVIEQYVAKKQNMTRQSVKNFCAMHGKRMIKIADLDCAHIESFDPTIKSANLYCHKDINQDIKSSAQTDRSPLFEMLYQKLSTVSPVRPPEDRYNRFLVDDSIPNSCLAWSMILDDGMVSPACGDDHAHFPLCTS